MEGAQQLLSQHSSVSSRPSSHLCSLGEQTSLAVPQKPPPGRQELIECDTRVTFVRERKSN